MIDIFIFQCDRLISYLEAPFLAPGVHTTKNGISFAKRKTNMSTRRRFQAVFFFASRKDLLFRTAVHESSYFAIVRDSIILPAFL